MPAAPEVVGKTTDIHRVRVWVVRNVVIDADPPKEPKPEIKAWTPGQVGQFLAIAKEVTCIRPCTRRFILRR